MSTTKNQIRFDYSTNPELAALFKNWKPGESYTVEVTFQLNSMDENGAEATIEEIAVDEEGAETEVEADADQPVAIVIKAGKSAEPDTGMESPMGSEQPYVPA